jgi:hypothetical protein
MFNPVPPGPEQAVPRYEEHDHEPAPPLGKWRPPGRWPALLRLSWLCRLLAVLSLAIGALLALLALLGAGERPLDPFIRVLYASVVIISAVVGYIFWTGIAELILLAIALELNTRQTRDRLPRHPPEDASRAHEPTRG